MQIDILFNDHNVPFLIEGHKHCRPGWVNTPCPFCEGNQGYHLGYNVAGDYFYCWRCGHHSTLRVIVELLRVPFRTAYTISRQYGGRAAIKTLPKKEKQAFTFPKITGPLSNNHRRYIKRRGFDPGELQELFGLRSTGYYARLGMTDYRFRVIVPIFWDGQIVSFQGRDVTDQQKQKYLACPQNYEIQDHKKIVYCVPHLLERKGIIVEGATDVWRFKRSTVCTFGIEYTSAQVQLLSKLFDSVTICFDPETQAQKQAKKLAAELRFRGLRTKIYKPDCDPGDMRQEQADKLVKNFLN